MRPASEGVEGEGVSRNLKGLVEYDVHPSAHEIADIFWAMDAEEQSGFFNRLAEIAGNKLVFQLQAITDSDHLVSDGRWAMSLIGDYAERPQ